jgi:hypothetical protein
MFSKPASKCRSAVVVNVFQIWPWPVLNGINTPALGIRSRTELRDCEVMKEIGRALGVETKELTMKMLKDVEKKLAPGLDKTICATRDDRRNDARLRGWFVRNWEVLRPKFQRLYGDGPPVEDALVFDEEDVDEIWRAMEDDHS